MNQPIVLTVYSSWVPNLTLVDLPGITRVAIEGQPENIEEITKRMAAKYCQDSKTIILCVVPANQDLSTQDSLVMARRWD
ncbi:MAG: dynamin family protein, partial [Pseudomonadota bacterium]